MKFAFLLIATLSISSLAHAECYKASTGTTGVFFKEKTYTVVCDDDPPGMQHKNMEMTSDQADSELKQIWTQELKKEWEQESQTKPADQNDSKQE